MVGRLQSEEAFVDWLRGQNPDLGDDTAFLCGEELAEQGLALTTDSQVAGTHFDLELDVGLVARRLLRVNLSDLAAAGARPRWVLCNVNAPLERFDLKTFTSALLDECARFDVKLIGGDTARSDTIVTTLTAIGDYPEGSRRLSRYGARPGDRLFVNDTLGEAALGLLLQNNGASLDADGEAVLPNAIPPALEEAARRAIRRHRLPRPALTFGICLAHLARPPHRAPSCLDISDGLLKDLGRLCAAARLGASVDLERFPLPSRFGELAKVVGGSSRELALSGGEDYVLLAAVPKSLPAPRGGVEIGEIVADPGIAVHEGNRLLRRVDIGAGGGWDHVSHT